MDMVDPLLDLSHMEKKSSAAFHTYKRRERCRQECFLQIKCHALKKQEAKADEDEGIMKNKLRQTETEKSQLEQELELSRKLLNQSEGSRETLLHQVEELRTQLMKAEGDRKGLQHQVSQISKQESNHQDEQGDDWKFRRGVEREKEDLEKQMSDLRVQLNFSAVASELEEVKRCMERRDKEKARLAAQVEPLILLTKVLKYDYFAKVSSLSKSMLLDYKENGYWQQNFIMLNTLKKCVFKIFCVVNIMANETEVNILFLHKEMKKTLAYLGLGFRFQMFTKVRNLLCALTVKLAYPVNAMMFSNILKSLECCLLIKLISSVVVKLLDKGKRDLNHERNYILLYLRATVQGQWHLELNILLLEQRKLNLTCELENREKQQLQMLDQLKEIQNHFETCEAKHKHADLQISELTHHAEDATKQAEQYLMEFQQSEALRQEAEKRREELKLKAQESIRQWKLKHKKLERALEKQSETLDQLTDKNNQILKEKEELKNQLYAALQQIENLRKELNEVLTKRALQEEELHCKEQKLSDVKAHQADLELEVKDSLETINRLESELKKQSKCQSQMKTEKAHLEEEIAELKKSQAKDKAQLLEMQEAVKDLSAIRADLANKLAEEQKARKEVLKNLSDLQTQAKSRDEETATIITQLKLERDVHQRELEDLTSSLQSVKTKHEQNIQELMKHFKKEKSEAEDHIRTLKAESLEDKNMANMHRCQLEKLKSQCDRLTEELTQNENENKKLKLKYQCLKDQLEEKNTFYVLINAHCNLS
ncbi:hypothetical protein HPG69_013287 [Diceros bicornis minor]|uniref:Uncharacterized protein n=1 Tax=Diceros bicornis minor TaxID=77932 RepID=A0A7J7F4G7_DICBM|nr:hypothetical protein HPG69_013287 [Diceros bicornis minor]